MSEQQQKTFNAITFTKYNGDPKHDKIAFRELRESEILVKVMASTIHPADLAFCKGQYGRLTPDVFPIIPGGEGAGIIESVADNLSKNLIGKRVGLLASSNKKGSYHGLWAEYHYTNLNTCVVFDDEKIEFSKITFTLCNPLTALGFLDTLKKHKVSAVVQNGATSAFGKMFIRLCAQNGIKNISLVRKAQNIAKLIELGAHKVISTSDEDWRMQLNAASKEAQATVCFECVGGAFTGQIISEMPKNSVIYHFGNLELKRLEGIDTSDFIFDKKILKGWWLMDWINGLKEEEFDAYKKMIKQSIESGSDLFLTGYSKTFPLEKFEEAFIHYVTNMSEGKIILEMHKD